MVNRRFFVRDRGKTDLAALLLLHVMAYVGACAHPAHESAAPTKIPPQASSAAASNTPDVAHQRTDVPQTGVIQTAAGGGHSCALWRTGNVRCWGRNSDGQLGYGHTNNIGDDETPASAGNVDIGGKATQIAAGGRHTCALLDTGKVRCWGSNKFGQLGYAHTNNIGDNETPSSVGDIKLGEKAIQIATGELFTCALLFTGKVRCWGYNHAGQLGYGHTKNIGDDETPASVGDVAIDDHVIELATGGMHTCALVKTGKVRCWGYNLFGQLGYGHTHSIGDKMALTSLDNVSIPEKVTQITAGGASTCALLDTGHVRCWGYNNTGQLGYQTTDHIGDNETPSAVGVLNIGGKVSHVVAGGMHFCALLQTGNIRCWGMNRSGELGYGHRKTIGKNETPASAGDVVLGGTVIQLSTGSSHSCALLDTGKIRCWGTNKTGQLGYGHTNNIGDDETPASAGNVPIE
jgi:alpha-tubulin suppressor-like RCC1 family protein